MTETALETTNLDLQASLSAISQNQLQFLQHLWEGVSYGIFVLDVLDRGTDFRYVAFNPAMIRTSPIPVEQLLGKTIAESVPDRMATLYHQRYRECVRSQESISFEEHFCHNGQETWWLITVDPLRDLNQIDRLLVTAIDISDRARMEVDRKATKTALADSENQFRRLVEDTNDAIGIWGLDGTITYVSPAFQTLFGYEPAEWLGKSFIPLIHPDDLPIAMAVNQQVVETGEKRSGLEFRNQHKDGHWFWVSASISTIKDTEGKIIAFQGILRDISDRKHVEKMLQLTQYAFDRAGNAMYWIQPDAKFYHANQTACQMLGYTLEELLSLSVFDVDADFPPDTWSEHWEQLKQQGSFSFESYQRTKNGRIYPVEILISYLEFDGKEYNFAQVKDISDRQQAEKEQARLLAILEATSDFVGSVDPSGRVLYINQAARRMSGLTPEDTIAHRNLTQNHPEWANQLILSQGLPEAIRSGSWLGETAILGANGQEIPVSQLILAHRSETGEIEYFSTIARDISDRKQQENALRFIVEGTVSKTGTEFFRACAQYMAELFQVQYAFITELADETFSYSRMLAFWMGEGFVEPFDFNLTGTPCGIVFKEGCGVFPDTLQARFPHVDTLAALGAESYLGVVIIDSQGKTIGNLGILDTKPLPHNLNIAQSILQLFATRVGAEMERNAAKMKLQEQEQFLRTVYEGANQPIFVIDLWPDRQFRYVGWNAAAEAASGMRSQDISAKTPEEIYGHKIGKLECQRLQECLISARSRSYEECRIVDGQESCWVTTLNPIQNSNGKIYRFIGTTFDISDRKTAEAVLSEYANRQTLLNQLVNQIRNSLDLDAVIKTTIQSIRNLLDIDACAFAWYSLNADIPTWDVIQEAKLADFPSSLGCYPTTVVGPIDRLLFNQEILRIDDAAQYAEPIHRAFLDTMHCQSEILLPIHTHSNRIGIIICVHYRQVRPWTNSEVELLKAVSNQLAIAIDQAELYAESRTKSQELQQTLQELQRTQAQMVQAEKMSSLGQLVAGIAHEINNPVNFIHGNLTHAGDYSQDLLDLMALYQREYPHPTPAIVAKLEDIDLDFLSQDLGKLLTSMKVGTERIREIVKSLRLFSRLDESEFKPVDIHDGLDSTLMILQSRLKAKRVRVGNIEYHLAEIQIVKNYGDLPEVECFAGQLNQVFMNILANAIDALEERDRMRSLTEQNQNPSTIRIITETTADRQVSIRIIDNGIGIPSHIKEKIFDPFFTTKPIGKGTGMGMSISYQIVIEKHRGQLFCHSTRGQGTEFVIQIPIQQHSLVNSPVG
jgi:PAS domain S-box-containing protein